MFSPIRYVQTGNGKIEHIATIAIIPTIKHKNITDNGVQIHVSKILKNEEKIVASQTIQISQVSYSDYEIFYNAS